MKRIASMSIAFSIVLAIAAARVRAELNPSHAEAYAALAEVRSALKKSPDDVIVLLGKAVRLDPSDPWIRMSAARAFWRMDKLEEARNVARVAVSLARDDERARIEAERLLATIPEKK